MEEANVNAGPVAVVGPVTIVGLVAEMVGFEEVEMVMFVPAITFLRVKYEEERR